MVPLSGILRRRLACVLSDASGQLFLEAGKLLRLDGVAAEIWERLEYPVDAETLCRDLATLYDVPPDTCRADVLHFLTELDTRGLLETELPSAHPNVNRDRYLKLLKRALTNLIYPEDALRIEALRQPTVLTGNDLIAELRDIRYTRPEDYAELVQARRLGLPRGAGYTFTMVGLPRLDNIERCAETIFVENIPGDFLEAGVCRGGCTIFMRALQKAFAQDHRHVWLADTFDGVPPPTAEQDIHSGLDLSKRKIPQLVASVESVLDNFRTLDLLDANVCVLKGLFSDTLPSARVEQIALLRLDGDLYSSTMDTLTALYDRVTIGGFIIVDDYGALSACRQAVDDFRTQRNITTPIQKIDYTGVFWRKES